MRKQVSMVVAEDGLCVAGSGTLAYWRSGLLTGRGWILAREHYKGDELGWLPGYALMLRRVAVSPLGLAP
jgi:hypothetical protein